jgi:L-ribulose-5-phosphate 4-epimerase
MGDIPITRHLTEGELKSSYETSLGKAVVECYVSNNITPREMPAILLRNHGSLVFGKTKEDAINNAIVLEEVSFMALNTRILNNQLTNDIKADILYHIHYERKHGNKKYYGQ